MSTIPGLLLTLIAAAAAIAAVLVAVFVVSKILWTIGLLIGGVFQGVGKLVLHIATTLRDIVTDTLRAIGGTLTGIAYVPLALGSVALGRWSAAKHYGKALRGELGLAALSIYKVGLSHPLRLVGLGSLLDGFERRLPEVVLYAPGADAPKEGAAAFDGWRVVGSLPSGGSGAKLYLAEATPEKADKLERANVVVPTQAVIKSFSLASGSTLPQIVRESRALESAKKLGLVLEHELSPVRFHYVMPYVPGEDLAKVTTALHAQAGSKGLRDAGIRAAIGYGAGLLEILSRFHAAGLWHKDIKPSNILICGDRVELVDLGLVTPLGSAMTLTTHGTEYYRDPEMVRLALRGVKVHEVDGVKFDLYSTGAVLYSLVEGSFPAHGNLSRFDKRCPDALRWIIRRAMADVNQRYASANEMLEDLRVLLAAKDPFRVKPADLPSMGGAMAPSAASFAAASFDEVDELETAFPERPAGTPPPLPLRRLNVKRDVPFALHASIAAGSRRAARQARHAAKWAAREARHQARAAAHQARRDAKYAARFASEEHRIREKLHEKPRRRHGVTGFAALFVLGFFGMALVMIKSAREHNRYNPGSGWAVAEAPLVIQQHAFDQRVQRDHQARMQEMLAQSRAEAERITREAPGRALQRALAPVALTAPAAPAPPARVLVLGERPLILGAEGERWLGRDLEQRFGWDVFGEVEASDEGSERDVDLLARARSEARMAPAGDADAQARLRKLVAAEPALDAVLWYGLDEDNQMVSRLVTSKDSLAQLGANLRATIGGGFDGLKETLEDELEELAERFDDLVDELEFELDDLRFELDEVDFDDLDWGDGDWDGEFWGQDDCTQETKLSSCGS